MSSIVDRIKRAPTPRFRAVEFGYHHVLLSTAHAHLAAQAPKSGGAPTEHRQCHCGARALLLRKADRSSISF